MKIALALVSMALSSALAAADVAAVDCGDVVPEGQTVVLDADLNCTGGIDAAALVVQARGKVDLNGHVITAGDCSSAIYCEARCTVTSTAPALGTIVSSGGCAWGIYMNGSSRVSRVAVSGFTVGLVGERSVKATGVFLSGNAKGTHVDRLRVVDSQATGNTVGFDAFGALSANGVVANDNGTGLRSTNRLRVVDVEATGNGVGVSAYRVILRNGVANGNGIDVVAEKPPRVSGVNCESSAMAGDPPSGTWGVCSSDPTP